MYAGAATLLENLIFQNHSPIHFLKLVKMRFWFSIEVLFEIPSLTPRTGLTNY